MPRSESPPRRRREDDERYSKRGSHASQHVHNKYGDDIDRGGSRSSHRADRSRSDWDSDEERRRRRKERERHRDRDRDRDRHHTSSAGSDQRSHRHHRKNRSSHAPLDDEEEAARRAKAAEILLYATEADDRQRQSGPSQTFTWAKKAEKERKMGMTPAEARKRDEDRRREAEEEIARLNMKREQREREQVIREEEESRMARQQESAAMAEWVAKEDDFYLEQSRKRAVIRIREERAKAIDILAINLKWVDPSVQNGQISKDSAPNPTSAKQRPQDVDDDDDADLEIDLEEPYLLFDNLSLKDTEELHQDMQMYLSLERSEQNRDFWRSMIVVCEDVLDDLRRAAGYSATEAGIRSRIDSTVKADMNTMLSGKTYDQLVDLQDDVRRKLNSGEPVDIEYWEGLLKAIDVWRAKAKLRDMHEVIITNRVEYLRHRQRVETERRERLGLPSLEEERAAKAAEVLRRRAEREAQREIDDGSADLMAQEAAKTLEEDEEVFESIEEDLSAVHHGAQNYSWEDKFRPRKPRYFNKVLTGFEWNKYNQTHYDHDNPPPKQVQGYKFNVFYPDLIDKSKAPTFRIVKEAGNDETCLIVFEAGPPYETIGFRIVNKPWNMSHQRGFKAVFERGVLQLHFNFQRMFYRK